MKGKFWVLIAMLVLFFGTTCVGRIDEQAPSESDQTQVVTNDHKPDEQPGENSEKTQVVEVGKMPVERAAHQATLLESGQVLITGGCAGNGCDTYLDSVELFDPKTRTFQFAAPMSTPRAGHAAVVLEDGRVMVCGGWTGQGATTSAELYDPVTEQWTSIGDMNDARESLMAVPLPDGRVLVTGGSGGQDDLASAEIFDPKTSTFTKVGPMGTNHYLATSLSDGRVLLTGGKSESGAILNAAEIFDPDTDEFRPTGNMETSRVKQAGALLPNGKVLIIGGSDTRGYSNRFRSTEIYDPTTGTFSPGPNLNFGRHKLRDAVVVLPSGNVLVAGGAHQLELFDATKQIFVPVEGKLSGPQMFATATLLQTGEVLVLGGYNDRTRSSANAWLVYADR